LKNFTFDAANVTNTLVYVLLQLHLFEEVVGEDVGGGFEGGYDPLVGEGVPTLRGDALPSALHEVIIVFGCLATLPVCFPRFAIGFGNAARFAYLQSNAVISCAPTTTTILKYFNKI